ncbi:MAG: hypothetical protein ABEH43_10005, partial [Flavobacteriales bacterium]
LNEVNPAQEHFISNLIRQKLSAAIDGQTHISNSSDKYLLFLPEGELHEIGLLMASYILKSHSKTVFYLGQSVPFQNLKETYHICKPDYMLTFFIKSVSSEQINAYIKLLNSHFPETNILISGKNEILKNIEPNKSIRILKDIPSLQKYIS